MLRNYIAVPSFAKCSYLLPFPLQLGWSPMGGEEKRCVQWRTKGRRTNPRDFSSEASLYVFYTLKTTRWGKQESKQDFAESYSHMAFNLLFSKGICCGCRVEVSVVKGNVYYGAGTFQLLWPLFCLGDKVKWCLLISDTFIKQANKSINQCLIIVFIYLIPLQHGHRLYYMDGPEFLR